MRRLPRFLIVALIVAAALAPMAASADHNAFFFSPAFNSSTAYGDPVTLTARLLEPDHDCPDNACPESNRQVDFYVDGEFVGTDVTNSGGYAHLLITAAQKWHVGSHQIRAVYERAIPPATITSTLTITKETTDLTAQAGYLQARLLDNDNVAVTGQPVTFWLITPAGEIEACTAYTDLDGNARCVPATGAGTTPADTVMYRAAFAGTGDYIGAEDTAALL